MVANKRQHWLPCVYLREFSDQPELGRKAPLRRFDGSPPTQLVSAESQCAKDFFFSTDTALEADVWKNLEGDWPNVLERLRRITRGESDSNDSELTAKLFLQLTTLHLRSAAFRLDDDGPRLDKILVTAVEFLRAIGGEESADGQWTLPESWTTFLIAADAPAFVTSDNPVVMFANEPAQMNGCFGAPVDEKHWAFVYDRKKMALTEAEGRAGTLLSLMNQVQAVASVRAIYAGRDLHEDELEELSDRFQHRPNLRGHYAPDYVQLLHQNFPPGGFFLPSA